MSLNLNIRLPRKLRVYVVVITNKIYYNNIYYFILYYAKCFVILICFNSFLLTLNNAIWKHFALLIIVF